MPTAGAQMIQFGCLRRYAIDCSCLGPKICGRSLFPPALLGSQGSWMLGRPGVDGKCTWGALSAVALGPPGARRAAGAGHRDAQLGRHARGAACCRLPRLQIVQLAGGASRKLAALALHAIGCADFGSVARSQGFGADEETGILQGRSRKC